MCQKLIRMFNNSSTSLFVLGLISTSLYMRFKYFPYGIQRGNPTWPRTGHVNKVSHEFELNKFFDFWTCFFFLWWFLGVADTNDVIQKIEKTLNNTHTTTQKLTNNSFRNTKKHPFLCFFCFCFCFFLVFSFSEPSRMNSVDFMNFLMPKLNSRTSSRVNFSTLSIDLPKDYL